MKPRALWELQDEPSAHDTCLKNFLAVGSHYKVIMCEDCQLWKNKRSSPYCVSETVTSKRYRCQEFQIRFAEIQIKEKSQNILGTGQYLSTGGEGFFWEKKGLWFKKNLLFEKSHFFGGKYVYDTYNKYIQWFRERAKDKVLFLTAFGR